MIMLFICVQMFAGYAARSSAPGVQDKGINDSYKFRCLKIMNVLKQYSYICCVSPHKLFAV